MKIKAVLILMVAAIAFGQNNDAGASAASSFQGFSNQNAIGTDSFDGSEPTMSPRFFRSGTPGDPCSEFSSGNFQYIEYPFFTDTSGTLTVNFDPQTCATGIFVTFHQQPFNPANICQNFVWAFGSSAAFSESFAVTPSSNMVMVVSGVANAPGVVCGPYAFEIIGDGSPASVPVLGSTGLMIFSGILGLFAVAFMVRKKKLA